jgi:ABC-2 type transport system permease protein
MTGLYGVFVFLGIMAAILLASPDDIEFARRVLPAALLLCFLYWQVIPILMASTGASLDMRKLLVYPIPQRQLFTLEVLLRVTSGLEMLILLTGAGIGLSMNPKIPFWAPLSLILFVALNLLCSAGVRDLLVRLMARRRIREIVTLLFVVLVALPQFLVLNHGLRSRLRGIFGVEAWPYWPWTAAARLAQGEFSWRNAGVMLAWTAAAYIFGRWQFERSFTMDAAESSASLSDGRSASRLEWFYTLPNRILRDPLAALVEKELRFLSRTPRFRLVFLMGFSFGILIWFPIAFGEQGTSPSWFSDNYLMLVSVYALLMLSDTLFWNVFGFDRTASQVYFLIPARMSTVLIGKNLAAVLFVALEISMVSLVCALLRLPISLMRVLESFASTLVVATFVLAVGNLSSVYNPRAINPRRSFRTAAGARLQALMVLLFPVVLSPVALAYLARYAFGSEWAFFAVLLLAAGLGLVVYRFSMESAVRTGERRKEQIIASLSQGEGLVQS